MIVTVTPNPSIDATLTVDAIVRGEVARATSSQREAGGKGINVANVAHKAGRRTLAIAPCGPHDPFDVAVRSLGIGFAPVEVAGAVRTNTALTESDGTTTKINEQGPTLTPAHTGALESLLRDAAADAEQAREDREGDHLVEKAGEGERDRDRDQEQDRCARNDQLEPDRKSVV